MRRRQSEVGKKLLGCFTLIVLLGVIGGGGWLYKTKYENAPPDIRMDLAAPYIKAAQPLAVTVTDRGSGLSKVGIWIQKSGKVITLAEAAFPGGGLLRPGETTEQVFRLDISPRRLGLTDGAAILRVTAVDHAWRRWWNGNRVTVEREVTIDTHTPDARVLSQAHNMAPGGSGLILYSLSEDCPAHGVTVGDRFFPGHSAQSLFSGIGQSIHAAFFALDTRQGPETPIRLRAVDAAGNVTETGFRHHIRSARFREDAINISDLFLNGKLTTFQSVIPPEAGDRPVDRFLWINRDLRRESYEELIRHVSPTDAVRHWEGDFLRMPASARQSGFGDRRSYRYEGGVIDNQIHMGIDLAATAEAPVPAANAGRVAFTGDVGIYGNTVMIDHGFGLFSTYSHLSRILTETGAMVARGDIIGKTGLTGLAGGDHLHFGMMIHDTFVNPVEWWDEQWIRHNVTDKIENLKTELRYFQQ